MFVKSEDSISNLNDYIELREKEVSRIQNNNYNQYWMYKYMYILKFFYFSIIRILILYKNVLILDFIINSVNIFKI